MKEGEKVDLELLKHANDYILKMANGINPLTLENVSENDLLNNIKISRCLFYVNSILNEVIKNSINGKQTKVSKKKFCIDRSDLDRYKFIEEDVSISKIVKRINDLKNDDGMYKLKSSEVTDWLLSIGLLEEKNNNGKKVKVPTQLGCKMGMYLEHRMGTYQNYDIVIYKKSMQEFIIDNFEELLDFLNKDKGKS